MSAVDALEGIRERLRTIRNLTVVTGVPDTIQKPHLAYVFYRGASDLVQGRHRAKHRRWGVRVLVNQHDNTLAEDEIVKYADSVSDALEADRTLGARVTIVGDIEQSAEADDGYLEIRGQDGNTVGRYRAVTFLFEVTDTY